MNQADIRLLFHALRLIIRLLTRIAWATESIHFGQGLTQELNEVQMDISKRAFMGASVPETYLK